MSGPGPDDRANHVDWIASERQYHNKHADSYIQKYGAADIFQVPESVYLFSRLPLDDGLTVLEVACGPSVSLSRHLRRTGRKIRYIGLDISDSLLDYARTQMPEGAFLLGDGTYLPIRPGSVDVIIALGGLHHIPELQKTCEGLLQALKSGGILLLREPSPEAFGDRWEGDSEHERGIEPEELADAARRHGAEVIAYERFNSECFHTIRHALHVSRLYHLVEPFRLYWRAKTQMDVFLNRHLGKRWPWFRGLDFCMAIRKTG